MKDHYEVLDESGETPIAIEFDTTPEGLEKAIQIAKNKNSSFVLKVQEDDLTEMAWINEDVFYRA